MKEIKNISRQDGDKKWWQNGLCQNQIRWWKHGLYAFP
jgi:hypothetical protein